MSGTFPMAVLFISAAHVTKGEGLQLGITG